VKSIGDERLQKVPTDLDLKPYRDYHDYELMQRMEAHIEQTPGLGARLKAELKSYASAFREEHEVERRQAARKRTTAVSKPAAKSAARKMAKKAPRAG